MATRQASEARTAVAVTSTPSKPATEPLSAEWSRNRRANYALIYPIFARLMRERGLR